MKLLFQKSFLFSFQPFSVDTLTIGGPGTGTGNSNVHCWMDIQTGKYPNVIKIVNKYCPSIILQNPLDPTTCGSDANRRTFEHHHLSEGQ